ncbi:hypothetical protein M2132_001872 [Dysgonomonas sp. PH5-45]|uniref:S8 family peptidase n=1 Tax=unclassified Dysgonomonas TaxID=2630389 RepID=UPI002476971C|nr:MULTISPECIES: S8 family serine peptidase [unclassified Dysgonomonas]MDH6355527.1 hypothetical protein [Dysgonomonas sp. PH5-45]MDH6388412.1 hypothetical protein [Dysgonomonas sp. PH5-37]
MKKFLIFIIVMATMLPVSVLAQNVEYKFRIYLTGKEGVDAGSVKAGDYLSQRALDRRQRQGIAFDEKDLPVSAAYTGAVEDLGCTVVSKSRWMNTLAVHCADSMVVDRLKQLPFVKDVVLVWRGVHRAKKRKEEKDLSDRAKKNSNEDYYGYSFNQIAVNNGQHLHEEGYRGEDMLIAVLDAGFTNIDTVRQFYRMNVVDTKNFVYGEDNMFKSSQHGLNVLSCMAINQPEVFVGTAPEANYVLLRTEDDNSEFPIEEDYWIAGAEYADSIGADLINSSLGYTHFGNNGYTYGYTVNDLDGKTAFTTKAADIAIQKGMLVVCSAGNEGAKEWRKMSVPSDGEWVLAVGAVDKDSLLAGFSSRGPSADFRIKPDVMAVGKDTHILSSSAYIISSNGTSFSSPVLCGMIACLWQACRGATNYQIIQAVREAGNRFDSPNNDYGYGIPDMEKALQIVQDKMGVVQADKTGKQATFRITSDSIGSVRVEDISGRGDVYTLQITDLLGRVLVSERFSESKTYTLKAAQKMLYIISLTGRGEKETYRFLF